ncbi:MAG TPA: DUF167 family protein [Hyphomicrobiales bacterium]|nr:DUF167 family protein [Hyphomicrobiales bacterium]
MAKRPWGETADGLRLAVRVVPGAGRDRLDGIATGADGRPALRIRLKARAVEGAANAALTAFLAAALGLRRTDVAIRSGAAARTKLIELKGDSADLAARLARWMDADRAG